MDTQASDTFRRTYKRNPSRFLLFPIGLLVVWVSLMILGDELFRGSRMSWPEVSSSVALLVAGVVAVWLACTRYTPIRRILTVLLGFSSICILVYSLRQEPPEGVRDTILVIITMSLTTYVWIIALRCQPSLPTSEPMCGATTNRKPSWLLGSFVIPIDKSFLFMQIDRYGRMFEFSSRRQPLPHSG